MTDQKNVRTYDPKQVAVFVGSNQLQGFPDGTFVSVERESETFEMTTGTDGTTSRRKSNDRSGTITVTLKQTSPSNAVLDNFAEADELANNGVFSMIIKDNSGDTVIRASSCWVSQRPTVEFGNEIAEREWEIHASNIDYNIGGNFAQTGENNNG